MSDLVGNPEDRFSHNEAHLSCQHYDNTPMLYTANINGFKNENFQLILLNYFLFLLFAQNIDCGYTLEPPQ